jgi:hypothetical protein
MLVTPKAEERTYARSSALIPWTKHSGVEFQEIDKVSQIRLSSHCFHLEGILRQTGAFTHGISFQFLFHNYALVSTASLSFFTSPLLYHPNAYS